MYKHGFSTSAASNNSGIKFKPGTCVWAQMNKKFWPAVIISHKDINSSSPNKSNSWVFWFGDYRVSEIKDSFIIPFDKNFGTIYRKHSKRSSTTWKNGVIEAIREFGAYETANLSEGDLLEWAKTIMYQISHIQPGLSKFVLEKLDVIRNKKENDDIGSKPGADHHARQMISEYNNEKRELLDVCLGCYTINIGVRHPIFNGYLCADCKVRWKDTFYVVKHDIKVYCTVCGFSGKMTHCTHKNCIFVYCQVCLDDFCGIETRETILETEKWLCFTCLKTPDFSSVLKAKRNWREYLPEFLGNSNNVCDSDDSSEIKRPIRVLSIFDCIASGLTSLIQQNINVDAYFSCETDTDCNDIVRKNYPGRVKFLGNVVNLKEEDLKRIIPIDLLLIGSPHSESSVSNPYRKGLLDSGGISLAFSEFSRLMKILQMFNARRFLWFFDFNANMNLQRKMSITRFLQCEPKLYNTSTAIWKRLTLVWNNFPIANEVEMLVTKKSLRELYDNDVRDDAYSIENIKEIEVDLGFLKEYTKHGKISNYDRLKILRRTSSVKFLNLHFSCFRERFENDN